MIYDAPTHEELTRIHSVIRWVEKRHGYIASSIVRMGQIHFTTRIETAGVVVDGPTIHLYFAPKFFNELKDAELAAVLIHEAFHVVFKHQARAELIKDPRDRHNFDMAAEAVINDIIALHFPDFILPGWPMRGMKLIGCDTSKLSVNQVVEMMREKAGHCEHAGIGTLGTQGASTVDNHAPWGGADLDEIGIGADSNAQASDVIHGDWTDESEALADGIMADNITRDGWGSKALGKPRRTPQAIIRKNLHHFLQDIVRPSCRYKTLWNQVPRKAMAIYPEVILPMYEPENRRLNVLMAVDSSGSIPSFFLANAVQTARQKIPGTTTTLVAFDTAVYEFWHGTTPVRGGGGTDVQAVENYALSKFKRYPNVVIVFSDGETPTPTLRHPERWIWILPPWGTTQPVARQSRSVYFSDLPG